MSKPKKTANDYFIDSGLKELKLLRKHFHIEGGGDDVHVTKEVTPADITNFYRDYFARVRPNRLGFDKILPKPNPTKLRALYMGDPDVNILLNIIVRHALYVDQILIVDPFLTLIFRDHPESVLKHPELWVTVVVNRALCVCALEEWIKQGLVLLFPNMFHYHPELLRIPSKLSNPPDLRQAFEHKLTRNLLVREHPEHRNAVLDLFARMGQEMSDSERSQLLEEAEQYERENPIRFRLASGYFDKHFPKSQTRGEIFATSNGGLPLIHASEFAEKTGSFLIFEDQFVYETLCVNFDQSNEKTDSLQQLSLAFQKLDFPFLHNMPLNKALQLRNEGYLLSFRNYLRELWQAITNTQSQQLLDAKIADFYDRLTSEYKQLEKEWEHMRRDFVISATITGVATGLTVIVPGNIALGFAAAAGGLGIAGYQNIRDLREANKKPLAVFLKLAH